MESTMNVRFNPRRFFLAFTLVEMLVAMAITLLMMAALARSFSFVGNQVRKGRGETQLANELRDLTSQINRDLARSTAGLRVAEEGYEPLGYFMYYEGPSTEATSSIFRASNGANGVIVNEAKYGDFDDYLAFTAAAGEDNWFTGVVPKYILDMKAAEIAGTSYTLPTGAGAVNAFEPVPIRSKYAEIIYFLSPEYSESTLPDNERYVDVDGDLNLVSGEAIENGLPDRMNLHRRVLLIRPDLNLNSGSLPSQTFDSVAFMQADTWPVAASTAVTPAANPDDAYRYGMASVHQQCDLSVRRVLVGGLPSTQVAANSLQDLSQPSNRFAHIQVPNTVLFGTTGSLPTSMPVLALRENHSIFDIQTSGPSPTRIAPPTTLTDVVRTPDFNGFLQPEFVLGLDRNHFDSMTDFWGSSRRGSDVIASNMLGFDIQVYDPEVRLIDTTNFATNPTNVIVGPSDAGYREALKEMISEINGYILPPPPALPDPLTADDFGEAGGFVDIGYPFLAGGSLRGWQARRLDRRQTTDNTAILNTGNFLVTPFSLIQSYSGGDTALTAYTPSFFRSGRLIVEATNEMRLMQPVFDTFTNFYESDGVDQTAVNIAGGTGGTVWRGTTGPNTDLGSDGLDSNGIFGADDFSEKETLPPTIDQPAAVRVSVRMENPKSHQFRQSSVTYRGK